LALVQRCASRLAANVHNALLLACNFITVDPEVAAHLIVGGLDDAAGDLAELRRLTRRASKRPMAARRQAAGRRP